jgi:energy-converting hydrogenase A subunit R
VNKRIFISSCEGPISQNNNVLDLTAHFVPEGDRVYDIIAKYAYIRANFYGRDNKIQHTSKLVLPFLLAFYANNKKVYEFSEANQVLRKNSKESLNYIKNISECFLIGTGFEHNVRSICRAIGFPQENAYYAKVNLAEFELSEKEKSKLRSLAWEIVGMSPITIPANGRSLQDLSSNDQATISRLDKIFSKEIAKIRNCKKIFSDVKIIGEAEKLNIVQSLLLSSSLENALYIGCDNSDVVAMKLIRAKGGLAISFNGTETAVRNADIVVMSEDYAPIAVLADLFLRFGKAEATRVAGNFDKHTLWLTAADGTLLNMLLEFAPTAWPKVYSVSEWNEEEVVKQAKEYRKTILKS